MLAATATGEGTVEQLLELARRHLEMDVAFVSQFTDGRQVYRAVDGDRESCGIHPGDGPVLEETICRRMIDGDIPQVVPDTAADVRVRTTGSPGLSRTGTSPWLRSPSSACVTAAAWGGGAGSVPGRDGRAGRGVRRRPPGRVGSDPGAIGGREAFGLMPLLAPEQHLGINMSPEGAPAPVLDPALAPPLHRLAIDDAGAGYASLRHVIELHPDFIKIDRSLVHGLAEDRARRRIVSNFVLLARDL
jgi:hypothetical protein